MSENLTSTTRKLEDLPSDGGRAVDTLAGAMLRIFVRLQEIEEANARLGRRLAALDGLRPSAAKVATSKEAPAAAEASIPAAPAAMKRGRGRPPGSPNRSKNGAASAAEI